MASLTGGRIRTDLGALLANGIEDLNRSRVLLDGVIQKKMSRRLAAPQTETQGSLDDDVTSSTTGMLDVLNRWGDALMLLDVLKRIHDVMRTWRLSGSASASSSTPAASTTPPKRWLSAMTQYLNSLASVAGASTPGGVPGDVGKYLFLVSRFVTGSVLFHVCGHWKTVSERRGLPLLEWVTELHRSCSFFVKSTTGMLDDESIGKYIVEDTVKMMDTAESVRVAINPGSSSDVHVHVVEVDASEEERASTFVLGGIRSLVQLIALYGSPDYRQRLLIEEPAVTPCGSKLRHLFMDDYRGSQSRRTCRFAMTNLVFVLGSCGCDSERSFPPQLGLFIREVWDRFLSSCEMSCFGTTKRGTVLSSRAGLAQFVFECLYEPLTELTATDASDNSLAVRHWPDMVTRTALYRILRLVGDLAESEAAHATSTGSSGGGSSSTAVVSASESSSRGELQRMRYKALLQESNGALTVPIVTQLAEDNGIMMEGTSSRSPGGHCVYRMFRVGAAADTDTPSSGRLRSRGVQQQWIYVDRGNVYVKKRKTAGGDEQSFELITSIADLLTLFSE